MPSHAENLGIVVLGLVSLQARCDGAVPAHFSVGRERPFPSPLWPGSTSHSSCNRESGKHTNIQEHGSAEYMRSGEMNGADCAT